MSTPVKPSADVDAIRHLDFVPRCETSTATKLLMWWLPTGTCRRQARWMATLPCCGLQVFSCQKHRHGGRKTVQICNGCGKRFKSVDSWRWVRI